MTTIHDFIYALLSRMEITALTIKHLGGGRSNMGKKKRPCIFTVGPMQIFNDKARKTT